MHKRTDMICYCASVTCGQIWDAMDQGARTLSDIKRATGAGTICRCKEFHPKGT